MKFIYIILQFDTNKLIGAYTSLSHSVIKLCEIIKHDQKSCYISKFAPDISISIEEYHYDGIENTIVCSTTNNCIFNNKMCGNEVKKYFDCVFKEKHSPRSSMEEKYPTKNKHKKLLVDFKPEVGHPLDFKPEVGRPLDFKHSEHNKPEVVRPLDFKHNEHNKHNNFNIGKELDEPIIQNKNKENLINPKSVQVRKNTNPRNRVPNKIISDVDKKQAESDIKKEKDRLSKMQYETMAELERVNDMKYKIKKQNDKLEQDLKIFESDRGVYYKIKQEVHRRLYDESEIPERVPIFFQKYLIFKNLDINRTIDSKNAYTEYLKGIQKIKYIEFLNDKNKFFEYKNAIKDNDISRKDISGEFRQRFEIFDLMYKQDKLKETDNSDMDENKNIKLAFGSPDNEKIMSNVYKEYDTFIFLMKEFAKESRKAMYQPHDSEYMKDVILPKIAVVRKLNKPIENTDKNSERKNESDDDKSDDDKSDDDKSDDDKSDDDKSDDKSDDDKSDDKSDNKHSKDKPSIFFDEHTEDYSNMFDKAHHG